MKQRTLPCWRTSLELSTKRLKKSLMVGSYQKKKRQPSGRHSNMAMDNYYWLQFIWHQSFVCLPVLEFVYFEILQLLTIAVKLILERHLGRLRFHESNTNLVKGHCTFMLNWDHIYPLRVETHYVTIFCVWQSLLW